QPGLVRGRAQRMAGGLRPADVALRIAEDPILPTVGEVLFERGHRLLDGRGDVDAEDGAEELRALVAGVANRELGLAEGLDAVVLRIRARDDGPVVGNLPNGDGDLLFDVTR